MEDESNIAIYRMQLAQGFVIATLAVGAIAQINCRGSAACVRTSQQNSQNILNAVQGIDTGRTYQNGERIACAGNICAFLENTGGITGDLIQELVQDLVNTGCAAASYLIQAPIGINRILGEGLQILNKNLNNNAKKVDQSRKCGRNKGTVKLNTKVDPKGGNQGSVENDAMVVNENDGENDREDDSEDDSEDDNMGIHPFSEWITPTLRV
ncbi:hypothetical protein TGAM01_v203671 [Trichoderma gamsii]|uniref:Killer toxin Kp4 domain-containing protein n=1 Tax=Trichoderma gamsii TaxID=398673 RepID=A0A2P4ZSL5_9HYPO|nr:hypothetical protein TGAM01_v203671 [Trichoderma gamsii]PON27290.1 hypothetical protein TGAM01_v203671 [Trichoderma gamsii]